MASHSCLAADADEVIKDRYSLVWQSVMWRPGKLRFLIGVKNPLPIRPAATARKHGPLRGRAGRQIRDFRRATPSFRRASGDSFSS
jgi:hypothetical protein